MFEKGLRQYNDVSKDSGNRNQHDGSESILNEPIIRTSILNQNFEVAQVSFLSYLRKMGFVLKISKNDDTLERMLIRTFAANKNSDEWRDRKDFFSICFAQFIKNLSEDQIEKMSENFVETWASVEDRG